MLAFLLLSLETLIKDLYEGVRVISSVPHGLLAVIHQQSKCPVSLRPLTVSSKLALLCRPLGSVCWGLRVSGGSWTGESWTRRCGCERALQAEGFLPVHTGWLCRACVGCLLRLGVLACVAPPAVL